MTARAVWNCPECTDTITGEADTGVAARDAVVIGVRVHLQQKHPAALANPETAQAWLAAAGHLVQLWGGPHDGERIWLPAGQLPKIVGVHRTKDGALVPIRSATARLLPHVDTYDTPHQLPDGQHRYLHHSVQVGPAVNP